MSHLYDSWLTLMSHFYDSWATLTWLMTHILNDSCHTHLTHDSCHTHMTHRCTIRYRGIKRTIHLNQKIFELVEWNHSYHGGITPEVPAESKNRKIFFLKQLRIWDMWGMTLFFMRHVRYGSVFFQAYKSFLWDMTCVLALKELCWNCWALCWGCHRCYVCDRLS